ncbi:Thioredoxin domain-containing protein [Candidatus Methanophagaceae archaeon]|nr:Thioredoxin domain-containing protein [Methanophagales archaeon]
MVGKKKLETFTAVPPCPGCTKLLELADRIKGNYGNELEVVKHIGLCAEFDKYGLTVVPAVVIGERILIMGVCPSEKTIKAALWEIGL